MCGYRFLRIAAFSLRVPLLEALDFSFLFFSGGGNTGKMTKCYLFCLDMFVSNLLRILVAIAVLFLCNRTCCGSTFDHVRATEGILPFSYTEGIRMSEQKKMKREIHNSISASGAPVIFTVPDEPLVNVPFYVTPSSSAVRSGDTLYLSNPSLASKASDSPHSGQEEYCSMNYVVEGTSCTIGAAGPLNLNETSCRITVNSFNLYSDRNKVLAGKIPTLYWCSSSLKNASVYLAVASIASITTTPPFIFSDAENTTLTVNSATPVGTEIGFYSTEDCQEPLNDIYPTKLNSDRTLWISALSTGNVAYICAKVFYKFSSSDWGSVPPNNDGSAEMSNSSNVIVFGVVYSSVRYRTFPPTEGVRYTNVTMMTNIVLSAFSLSSDPLCLDLVQPPQYPSSSGNVVMYLSASMGTYFFCGVTVSTAAGGVFVPAENQFSVLEYGIVPTSMYAGTRTTISLTKNATNQPDGITFQNSLFLDSSCQNFVDNFSWTTSLSWPGIARPGTYYACVRQKLNPSTTTALANSVLVFPTPTLRVTNPSFNDSVVTSVFGMGMTVSIERNGANGELVCGIGESKVDTSENNDEYISKEIMFESDQGSGANFGGLCSAWTSSLNSTSSTTVQFVVPHSEESEKTINSSVTYLCLSTPDYNKNPAEGYFYLFQHLNIVPYPFTYNPLFSSISTSINLSGTIPISGGSEAFFLPVGTGADSSISSSNSTVQDVCNEVSDSATSSSVGSENYFTITDTTTALYPITFPSGGYYALCLKQSDYPFYGYHTVESFAVYSIPAVMVPSAVVTGLTETVQISGLPPGAPLFFSSTADCDVVGTDQELFSAVSDEEGLANATITPTTSITNSTGGILRLCVFYPREINGISSTVPVIAGTLNVTTPVLYPQFAVVEEQNTIFVKVGDSQALDGGMFYVLPLSELLSTDICSGTIPSNVLISGPLLSADSDSFFTSFFYFAPPQTNEKYIVCVSPKSGAFVSAGNLLSVEAPFIKFNPSDLATINLPITGSLNANSFLSSVQPDVYAVIGSIPPSAKASSTASTPINATPCSNFTGYTIYHRGSISYETGEMTPFKLLSTSIAPDAMIEVTICFGNQSSLLTSTMGYFYGGNLPIYAFTALSRYAVLNAFNSIISWPPVNISGTVKYLTPCPFSGCSGVSGSATAVAATTACQNGTQFFTSSILALTGAPPGEYYFCEQMSDGQLTGSNSTVIVISSSTWGFSVTPFPIRQYRPFTVSVRLPGAPSTSCKLIVQSAETPCGQTDDAAETQVFSIDADSESSFLSNITITNIQPVSNVTFCVEPTPYDSLFGASATLNFYPTPAALIAGKENIITSGGLRNDGVATKIASTPECDDMISANIGQLQNFKSTLSLDSCGATSNFSRGYYCESVSGSFFVNRGRIAILHTTGCLGSGEEAQGGINSGGSGGVNASIAEVMALPGVPISSTGIIAGVLENPLLSKTSDCSLTLPQTVISIGYTPEFNETAVFFVCATIVGSPNTVFTTMSPTLTVNNWGVSPTSVLSRYSSLVGVPENTTVMINYRTSTSQTFFSMSPACETSIGSAASMSTSSLSATYDAIGTHGLGFVCTANIGYTGAMLPISAFLSVSTPTVSNASLAIMNEATYVAVLTVKGYNTNSPLYSMQSGQDSNYPYSSYYTTNNRDVFLSSDSCKTVLSGTEKTTVTTSNRVYIMVNGLISNLTQAFLCTGTPAGVGVASIVPVSSSSVYPTVFFTGISSPIYAPLFSGVTVSLSFGENVCSQILRTIPSFTFDNFGFGTIVLSEVTTGNPVEVGVYTLCQSGQNSSPIGSIQVIEMLQYKILGELFIVGVPSIMELQYNLTVATLISGFSTSRDCEYTTTIYGEWSQISSTSIEVTAAVAVNEIYLCAKVEVNNTVVSLPSYPSHLTFFPANESVRLPAGGLTTCASNEISDCTPPGIAFSPGKSTIIIGLIYGDCCNSADREHILGTTTTDDDGTCSLTLNEKTMQEEYPLGTNFTMCAWNSEDDSYCVTLANHIGVSTDCTANSIANSRNLSAGWVVFIIIACILAGLLIALGVVCLWYYFFRNKSVRKKEKRLVAVRQVEGKETLESLSSSNSEDYFILPTPTHNPLLYYAGVTSTPLTSSMSWTSCRNPCGAGVASGNYSPAGSERELKWEISTERQGDYGIVSKEAFELEEMNRKCSCETEEKKENKENRVLHPLQMGLPSTVWAVQCLEDDSRDQIALEEAKKRYYLFLESRENLERQRLKEKEEEVELGYEDDQHDGLKAGSMLTIPISNVLNPPRGEDSFCPACDLDLRETSCHQRQPIKEKRSASSTTTVEEAADCVDDMAYQLVSLEEQIKDSDCIPSKCLTHNSADENAERWRGTTDQEDQGNWEYDRIFSHDGESTIQALPATIKRRTLSLVPESGAQKQSPRRRRHHHDRKRLLAIPNSSSHGNEEMLNVVPAAFLCKKTSPHETLKCSSGNQGEVDLHENIEEESPHFPFSSFVGIPLADGMTLSNDVDERFNVTPNKSSPSHCDPTNTPDVGKTGSSSPFSIKGSTNKSPLKVLNNSSRKHVPEDSQQEHSLTLSHYQPGFEWIKQPLNLEQFVDHEEDNSPCISEPPKDLHYSSSFSKNGQYYKSLSLSNVDETLNEQVQKVSCRRSSSGYNDERPTKKRIEVSPESSKESKERGYSNQENFPCFLVGKSENSLFALVEINKEKCCNEHPENAEMDAMSYTTTQRYYDENHALHEEEAARRQRWKNCEEDERGNLVQRELEEYVVLFRDVKNTSSTSRVVSSAGN